MLSGPLLRLVAHSLAAVYRVLRLIHFTMCASCMLVPAFWLSLWCSHQRYVMRNQIAKEIMNVRYDYISSILSPSPRPPPEEAWGRGSVTLPQASSGVLSPPLGLLRSTEPLPRASSGVLSPSSRPPPEY